MQFSLCQKKEIRKTKFGKSLISISPNELLKLTSDNINDAPIPAQTPPLDLKTTTNQSWQFLSDFLPYDPSTKKGERLKDGLKEYLLLLTLTEEAIEAVLKDELYQFDPLVGENACQIRAVKIALISRNSSNEQQEKLALIQRSKIKTLDLIEKATCFSDAELSLKDILDREDANIKISEDESFLIISFFLTKTKVVNPFFKKDRPLVENAHTDYKKIKEVGNVGSSFSCELIKKLRRKLAAHSVDYIQEIAKELDLKGHSTKLLTEQHLFVHNGLKCLPYYWATRILMHHALNNNIPIAMLAQQIASDQDYKVIQNMQIFFISTPQGYQKICRTQLDPAIPVIVLIGSTCRNLSDLPSLEDWEKELVEQCPIDLVLAYAAAHRQYPDESHKPEHSDLFDTNYEYHKAKAAEWGCSIANPSRFFLTHAFCDKIKNIDCLATLKPSST